ncbi:UDP-N-acetylmuramate dehydrogenase [Burkholderiaceae bacterium DAT-1]|nr:UDP-N-acetylmuramate dehydrogenase [Burkholderiaceae bacterium DAT-1]
MGAILQDVDLQAHNTLALPARAEHFAVLDELSLLDEIRAQFSAEQIHVLGGGSNLWLPERVRGLVLQVALKGKTLTREDADHRYITASAGENWHDLVLWTLAQGWGGLENLSLIPGTVGAAPVQNVGAYGVEIADRFHSLTAVNLDDGQLHIFTADMCQFAYRHSIFKRPDAGRWLITAVTFRLPRVWTPVLGYGDLAARLASGIPTPVEVADAVMAIRRSKLPDPAVIPNAGSFFHNPVVEQEVAAALKSRYPALPVYPQADGRVKLAAGWLIEQCGWKGRTLGHAGMFDKQALVLVNHGGAVSADIAAVCAAVRADVLTRFGVSLNPEPIRW